MKQSFFQPREIDVFVQRTLYTKRKEERIKERSQIRGRRVASLISMHVQIISLRRK